MIIRDESLGKIKYYAIRAEFQFRGSPHIHSFLWVTNGPTLTEKTINEYLEVLGSGVCGHLVKTFQIHFHSKTCRKCNNSKCRFKFGGFFTDKTIIATPLQHTKLISLTY